MSKVHEIVTDQILNFIKEEKVMPWQKPWNTTGHKNLNSKRGYNGINRLLLEAYAMRYNYTEPWWFTYKGAGQLGGNIKKGEKSHIIVFYKTLKVEEDGDEKSIPLLRYYRVFNYDQAEGDIKLPETKELDFKPVEKAEEVIKGMPNSPETKFGGDRAFYMPKTDKVGMPKKKDFKSVDGYYCTYFHELAHSTGHTSRLSRPDVMEAHMFGDEDYSKEELVAEISSAMLGAHCNLDPSNIQRATNYVGSWLKALNNDPKWIVQASAKAQKAVEYILDEEDEEEE